MMRAIGQPLNFSKAASEIEQICHSGKKVFEFCLRPPDWVVDCPPFGQLGGRDLVYQVAKCHGGEDGNHRDGARGGRVAGVGVARADVCVVLLQNC